MTEAEIDMKSSPEGCTVIAKIGHKNTARFIEFLRKELNGKPFSALFNQTDDNGFEHDRFELVSSEYPGISLEGLSSRFRPY